MLGTCTMPGKGQVQEKFSVERIDGRNVTRSQKLQTKKIFLTLKQSGCDSNKAESSFSSS